MGITNSNAAFLARACKQGVCLGNTLTIGHQQSYVDAKMCTALAKYLGRKVDDTSLAAEPYIDRFLREALGAKDVKSMDVSNFEKCDLIHDLNQPIGEDSHGRFDTVIDGGCLEHVFNVPTAMENYMRLVRPGGRLFVFTMANNHSGHGFYQLGPTFFYGALQEQYGYRVEEMVLDEHPYPSAEMGHDHQFYAVAPRESIKGRINFISRRPVTVMVHAERTGDIAGFDSFPIQHSYMKAHSKKSTTPAKPQAQGRRRTGIMVFVRSLRKRIHDALPAQTQERLLGRRQLRNFRLRETHLFKRIQLP